MGIAGVLGLAYMMIWGAPMVDFHNPVFILHFYDGPPYDNGIGVKDSMGNPLQQGDLTIQYYTNETGGHLYWQNTYPNAIINGSWHVIMPDMALPVEYDHWKSYQINGEQLYINGNPRVRVS